MESWVFAMIGSLLIIDAGHCGTLASHVKTNDSCVCGISGEEIGERIVGGKVSIPHIFPWIVAIYSNKQLHCGGSLINNYYVLTAGHCVKWTDPSTLTLGFGKQDIKDHKEGFEVPAEKVLLHQKFESDYLHDTNDIALIKVKDPISFTKDVRPVCLSQKGDDYTGKDAQVTGWGRVLTNGAASRYLRQASVKIMPLKECQNTTYGEHITSQMMCAYSEGQDACQGDSGGPLLMKRKDGKFESIGIVSWGIDCASPGIPGVYVKNSDYLHWIHHNTRDATYCRD